MMHELVLRRLTYKKNKQHVYIHKLRGLSCSIGLSTEVYKFFKQDIYNGDANLSVL